MDGRVCGFKMRSGMVLYWSPHFVTIRLFFAVWPRRMQGNSERRERACNRFRLLTTGVLNGLPLFECSFDRQKIFMFAVGGMLLDGCASPSKSPTTCRANGIFREDLSQCVRELKIKCRNVGAANHGITPTPENVRGAVRPFACGLATTRRRVT